MNALMLLFLSPACCKVLTSTLPCAGLHQIRVQRHSPTRKLRVSQQAPAAPLRQPMVEQHLWSSFHVLAATAGVGGALRPSANSAAHGCSAAGRPCAPAELRNGDQRHANHGRRGWRPALAVVGVIVVVVVLLPLKNTALRLLLPKSSPPQAQRPDAPLRAETPNALSTSADPRKPTRHSRPLT